MSDTRVLNRLLAEQGRFRAFLIARLGSEADADEVLQGSLVKALGAAAALRDDEKLIAWFYQVLRRAMIDHVRSRRAAAARDEAWAALALLESDSEAHQSLCRCFEALFGEMKPREATLLRRVELEGATVAEVAQESGLTPNHAGVILHRARKRLRDRLTEFCGECANGACLDCECPPESTRQAHSASFRPSE